MFSWLSKRKSNKARITRRVGITRKLREKKRGGKIESALDQVKDAAEKLFETYVKLDDFAFESIVYKDRFKKKSEEEWKKDMTAADKAIPKIDFNKANAVLDLLIKQKGIKFLPKIEDLNKFNSLSNMKMMVLLYKCDTRNYFFNLEDFMNDKILAETGKNELEMRKKYIVNNLVLNKIAFISTPTVKADLEKKLGKILMDQKSASAHTFAVPTIAAAGIIKPVVSELRPPVGYKRIRKRE